MKSFQTILQGAIHWVSFLRPTAHIKSYSKEPKRYHYSIAATSKQKWLAFPIFVSSPSLLLPLALLPVLWPPQMPNQHRVTPCPMVFPTASPIPLRLCLTHPCKRPWIAWFYRMPYTTSPTRAFELSGRKAKAKGRQRPKNRGTAWYQSRGRKFLMTKSPPQVVEKCRHYGRIEQLWWKGKIEKGRHAHQEGRFEPRGQIEKVWVFCTSTESRKRTIYWHKRWRRPRVE